VLRIVKGLVGAALCCAALSPLAARAETPRDTFVMAKNVNDLTTFDPGAAYSLSELELNTNIYDRLMRYDAEDVRALVGGIVESWSISVDGLTYTFKIRPGLKFHSGSPVTAEDAAFSLQRAVILDRGPAFILNQFGLETSNVKQAVNAIDADTLVVRIGQPFGETLVLTALSAGVGSVVEKKVALEHEVNGDLGAEWLKTHDAGSGAYMLKSWKPNELIALDAFDGFWKGSAKNKRVIIRHVTEPASQRLLLEKGDIDLARNLSSDMQGKLAANPKIEVAAYPKADEYYIGLNQADERLQKPQVREALRWLIDYDAIATSFGKGQLQVHQSFWPAGFEGALTDLPFHFDVARAKQLLSEAGYPDGFQVDMDVSDTSPFPQLAQAIQSSMAEAGIKVNVVSGEQKQVVTKYKARQHQLVLWDWASDYPDINSNATAFARNPDQPGSERVSTVASRNSWFGIDELTAATDAAGLERDPKKRVELYLDLQKKLQADSPYVFLFQGLELTAFVKGLKGYVSGPLPDSVFYRLVEKQ
jgi:peptide/nickel transport system substrate-binding protein